MGRSSRLAIGAIAAAVAAGQVAPSHLGAAVALGLAAILLLNEARPALRAGMLLPVALGAALITLRLAVMPAETWAVDEPPEGRGPWTMVVESTGSPRDGQQVATLATTPDAERPFRVAATLPRYPEVVPGDVVTVDGTDPAAARLAVRRLPGADRRGRDAVLANADRPADARRPGSPPRGSPAGRRRGADPRPPRARGGARGRDPDRPARPRGP